MKLFFNGICTAMITPFKNGEIDFPALGKIIEFQIQNNIDALLFLGTTGEASTLTFEEKIDIIKFAVKIADGRIPLVFGIGGNNPAERLRLGNAVREHAPKCAVMMTAPYYNKCTQDAAIKHFNAMANAIKLPMFIYNIPGRAGMNLTPATIAKICKNKYIAGIKESSGNMAQIIEVVRLCSKPVYCGDDALSLPCYAIGCMGTISVASNVRPRETRAIWKGEGVFYELGKIEDLTMFQKSGFSRLFYSQLPFYDALFCEVNPGPIKYAMHLAGFCEPDVRPPLTILSQESIITHEFRKFFRRARD